MTYPVIPTLPTAPTRQTPQANFVELADAFVGALQPWGNQINAFGDWTVLRRNEIAGFSSQAGTFRNQAQGFRNEAETFRNQASTHATNAANSASNAIAAQNTVLNNQAQAGAILGAGVGTTFIDDGDLNITYIAPVTNVFINSDGFLSITYN